MKRHKWPGVARSAVAITMLAFSFAAQAASLEMEKLGRAIFNDKNLSANRTQACADCHDASVGHTGPDSGINLTGGVMEGAIRGRFGNRKPPSSAYTGDSPVLDFNEEEQAWVGGMFWDGRATGWTLDDPLAEQAQGPFLNPLEHGLPGARQVVIRVAQSEYANLFKEVWGPKSLDFVKDVSGSYDRIARSIAAFERSPEVTPFTSKFDLFWINSMAAGKDITKITAAGIPGGMGGGGMGGGGMGGGGMGGGGMGGPENNPARWEYYRGLGLTDIELQGLAIYNDSNRGDCASCHTLTPGSDGYPLFTDFKYHNIGIPKNPKNPF
jgi:cytochrome c peroxidase